MPQSLLQPAPFRTPFFAKDGQIHEEWRRFFLSSQALVNLLLQEITLGMPHPSLVSAEEGDPSDPFIVPGPTGSAGGAGPPGKPGFDGEDGVGTFEPILDGPVLPGLLIAARATNASGTISIANQTVVAITFATDDFNPYGMHSTVSNTSRLTAPVAGKYLISGGFLWSAQAGTSLKGLIFCAIAKNGTVVPSSRSYYAPMDPSAFSANGQGQTTNTMINLAVNDYVELVAYQDQTPGGGLGVTLTIDLAPSTLQAAWLGP